MADRREEIADAGVRLIAGHGLRALTHRAIDAELGLPIGSTSYYARTKRDLIALIARRLAHRTQGDISAARLPSSLDVASVAEAMAAILDFMARRPADHRARFALLLELREDDELHGLLSGSSPVRKQLLDGAAGVLDRLKVDQPEAHAPNLVVVLDGLLFDRVAGSGKADAAETIRAFLAGLPKTR